MRAVAIVEYATTGGASGLAYSNTGNYEQIPLNGIVSDLNGLISLQDGVVTCEKSGVYIVSSIASFLTEAG